MLKMVITAPTALGVGRVGIFYGLAKSRKYDGLNVSQKTAEESLKSETKHGTPCPVKRPRKEEKKMKNFNELPKEVQEQLKGILRAYSEETVYFENGKYTFGVSIKAKYAPDHEYIGTYYAKDIYTEEERIVNYCEEFHSYPPEYKGKRDYNLIKDYNAKYKMVDGNIIQA